MKLAVKQASILMMFLDSLENEMGINAWTFNSLQTLMMQISKQEVSQLTKLIIVDNKVITPDLFRAIHGFIILISWLLPLNQLKKT